MLYCEQENDSLRSNALLKDGQIEQLIDSKTKLFEKCASQKSLLASANETKKELAKKLRHASDERNIVLQAAQLVADDYRNVSLRELNPCPSIAQGVRDGSISHASPAYSNQRLEGFAPFASLFTSTVTNSLARTPSSTSSSSSSSSSSTSNSKPPNANEVNLRQWLIHGQFTNLLRYSSASISAFAYQIAKEVKALSGSATCVGFVNMILPAPCLADRLHQVVTDHAKEVSEHRIWMVLLGYFHSTTLSFFERKEQRLANLLLNMLNMQRFQLRAPFLSFTLDGLYLPFNLSRSTVHSRTRNTKN